MVNKGVIQLEPARTPSKVSLFLGLVMALNPPKSPCSAEELWATPIFTTSVPVPSNNKRPITDGPSESVEGKIVQIGSLIAVGTTETYKLVITQTERSG